MNKTHSAKKKNRRFNIINIQCGITLLSETLCTKVILLSRRREGRKMELESEIGYKSTPSYT